MKKCIKLILVISLSILNIFTQTVYVEALDTLGFTFKAIRKDGEIRWQTKTYGELNNSGIFEGEDEEVAYCIEPGIEYLSNSKGKYNVYTSSNSIKNRTGFDEDTIRKLSLISHYGYGDNDETNAMYMATQLEIWEVISPGCCELVGSDVNTVDKKRDKIMTQVQSELQTPSFMEEEIIIYPNHEFKLIDRNNVLGTYQIKSCTNCKASINEEILTVKTENTGEIEITLVKEFESLGTTNYLYDKGDYQQLMRFRYIPSMEVSFKLESVQGIIKINKVDSETGLGSPQGNASLKGAEYTVYDSNRNIVGTIITDEKGYGELLVGLGTFYIKETKSPTGYLLDLNEYEIALTSDNYEPVVTLNQDVIKGKVEILKLYGDDELGYLNEVGAEFEILDSNNKVVEKIIINEDGKGSVELPYGNYTLRQTKGVENFTISNDKKFSIDTNNQTINFEIKNISYPRLEITKKDAIKNIGLKGATINVYKLNESTNEYELYASEVSDDKGKILLKNLELGKYYFVETKAPSGYVLNNEKVYIDILEYGKTYRKELINEKYSTLEIIKVDSDNGEPLEGATIDIYKFNNTSGDYEFYDSSVTSKDGKIFIDKIEIGKYYFIESVAPVGYVLNQDKNYFEITKNYFDYELTLENEKIKGIIRINKVDEDNNTLSGVIVGIYTEDGTLINSYESNELGIIEVELEYGSYYYQEISTIDGYILNDEKVFFNIEENEKVLEYILINEKEIVEVPDTYSSDSTIFIAFGATIFGAMCIVYETKRKKKC